MFLYSYSKVAPTQTIYIIRVYHDTLTIVSTKTMKTCHSLLYKTKVSILPILPRLAAIRQFPHGMHGALLRIEFKIAVFFLH
jgi:hypothetical protein